MEATEHVDPPSGISLRLAVLVFVVSAMLASGVFVVWSSFDMPTTDDPVRSFPRYGPHGVRVRSRPAGLT